MEVSLKTLKDHVKQRDLNEKLITATMYDNIVDVEKHIKNGANINAENNSPFFTSIRYNRFKILEYYLNIFSKNFDISIINSGLKLAGEFNENVKIIELLVNNGADIHLNNNELLEMVCKNGKLKTIQYIIRNQTVDLDMKINEIIEDLHNDYSQEVKDWLIKYKELKILNKKLKNNLYTNNKNTKRKL